MIRNSELLNFLGHVPVHSQLNVKALRFHLKNYWDQQLVDLIEQSFPLDFDRNSTLGHTLDNQSSALQFSDHVDQYISEQLQHRAFLGPFQDKPCPLHFSPNITYYITGIRVLYILPGLDTQCFRDQKIPLFIKALQINRPI